jgi:biopolymer transport protein TolQ
MHSFSGSSIWQLVKQSDWMTSLVLLSLLVMSIACWVVFFYKILLWRAKKHQLKGAGAQLKNAKSLEDVLYIASKFSHGLAGYFLSKNLSYLKTILVSSKGGKEELNDREWDFVNQVSNDTLDNVVYQQESFLPVLSVCAGVAPLLGLFGTVWGLVHSFVDISQKQSADIATVAPGIAEALITTLAGLMVAIPSLAMYHYLKLQVLSLEQRLIVVSNRYLALVQKLFTKGSNAE